MSIFFFMIAIANYCTLITICHWQVILFWMVLVLWITNIFMSYNNQITCPIPIGRNGSNMVSALVPGSSSLGLSPGWGHCCVLGEDTILSWCLAPPRRIKGTRVPSRGGIEILFLAPIYYRNWDKLCPDGPLGSLCRYKLHASYILQLPF